MKGLQKLPYESQIDAIIIAQQYGGLHTINGYGGQSPPGWSGLCDFDKQEYFFYLNHWIQRYHLEKDRLYFLDLKTGN